MGTALEKLETDALALPKDDRLRLALHLLESVDDRAVADPKAVEQAWLAEAERRYLAYQRGDDPAIPAEQVFATLRDE